MGTWIGLHRTNYFRVKDADAFHAEMRQYGDVEVWYDEEDPAWVGLGSPNGEGWPSWRYVTVRDADGEETEVEEDIEFVEVVRQHLADGEIAVFVCGGFEKARYATGYAFAVDNTGESVEVSLRDIYELAEKKFGKRPTAAEY